VPGCFNSNQFIPINYQTPLVWNIGAPTSNNNAGTYVFKNTTTGINTTTAKNTASSEIVTP
jgi:hypothetical protein